jgi:hypothetical protein
MLEDQEASLAGSSLHSPSLFTFLSQDPDYLRLCISQERPRSISNGIPQGLYLRDIAETRLGANAFDFIHHTEPPEYEDYCLSLIGTETVLCLQLPTKVPRVTFSSSYSCLFLNPHDVCHSPSSLSSGNGRLVLS